MIVLHLQRKTDKTEATLTGSSFWNELIIKEC